MADPFTIVSLVAVAVSTITSVIGSITQGNAAAKANVTNQFTAMAKANQAI